MASRRLTIYLNDHRAGSIGALELARRSAHSNRGTELGDFLDGLVSELAEDKLVLEDVMDQVGASADRAKTAAAWTAEKLGRPKLNDSLLSYSPLSRLEELELLVLAVSGKLLLWQALEQRGGLELASIDFQTLAKRAQSQLRRLKSRRLEAVPDAL